MYKEINRISVRYEVWRDNLPYKMIEAYEAVSLSHSVESALKTSLSGTFLQYSGVNFNSDKLHVSIEINGISYPLGIFCVTTEMPRMVNGLKVIDIEGPLRQE